jgi:amino acid adenylation domain-containing protein
MNFNLAFPFSLHARRSPENVALWIHGETWTYREVHAFAQRTAAWLTLGVAQAPRRVGILASRSLETYVGILGTCWTGAAYVPISPKWPEERLIGIFERTDLDALIVDAAGFELLSPRVLAVSPKRVLAPAGSPRKEVFGENKISFHTLDDLQAFDPADEPAKVDAESLAYLIFTSGSTGVPKGVMISAGNARAFVDAIQARYQFQPDDRVAQPSEVSFDNSVFDLLNAWEAGAALFVVPASQLVGPLRFLQENAITVWYSVPSFAVFMSRMKMLRPGALPALRYSAFAGEALPQSTAEAWKSAASNSIVDCLYGPTETTVVCTGDRYSDEAHVTESRGIISIGTPFPGTLAAIVDPHGNIVARGGEGELAIAGSQVALGYFKDEGLTGERFPVIDGKRWYLTGDLAIEDEAGRFHHLGRVDNQVKIQGIRVELEEVEAHLRSASGSDSVAAVAWPMRYGTAERLVAFVSGATSPIAEVSTRLKRTLPAYMVPARIYELDSIPMSSNGKIDRNELARMLYENHVEGQVAIAPPN